MTPSKKKPKRATEGEKIAEGVATTCEPFGLICLNLGEKKNLARAIDTAIRRAVREAYASGVNSPLNLRSKQLLNTRYGVKL